jgi:hypothetical protein
MGQRLGVKRLNALNKQGQSVSGDLGTGVSGSVGHRSIMKIGREVITEIYVDLGSSQGALYDTSKQGEIIGHSSSAEGVQTAGKANLTQVTTAENGVVTLVEMTCVETPTGGATDIDLSFAATAQVYSGSSGLTQIIDGGAQVIGSEGAKLYDANELEDQYLYLTTPDDATEDGAAAAEYTAGKLLIRLYGHAVPDDV